MARSKRRREQHRTSIVERDDARRAQLLVPATAIEVADLGAVRPRGLASWFPLVRRFPPDGLPDAPATVSLVLDDYSFVLYAGTDDRGFELTGTHDGTEFVDAALDRRVDVYLAWDVDVRRASDGDLDTAANAGNLAGAAVSAFGVQTL